MSPGRFVAADPTQVMEAGRVWERLFPNDRVALYLIALGYYDPKQERAKNDWYEIPTAERVEIASQMIRWRGYFEEFD
jgi:hypothetical protein